MDNKANTRSIRLQILRMSKSRRPITRNKNIKLPKCRKGYKCQGVGHQN